MASLAFSKAAGQVKVPLLLSTGVDSNKTLLPARTVKGTEFGSPLQGPLHYVPSRAAGPVKAIRLSVQIREGREAAAADGPTLMSLFGAEALPLIVTNAPALRYPSALRSASRSEKKIRGRRLALTLL